MIHELHLKRKAFQAIYDGYKTIELRLYDEKRQAISVNDEIRFIYLENERIWMRATVTALHRFTSFEELYRNLPLLKCGYTEETVSNASYLDMEQYYSPEKQSLYGVIGIEFELLPHGKQMEEEAFIHLLGEFLERETR